MNWTKSASHSSPFHFSEMDWMNVLIKIHQLFLNLVYGRTKLAFEDDVMGLKNGIVFRLSNMIGPKYKYQKVGGKFLQFLTEKLATKEYIGLLKDQIRSFVSVVDVASVITKSISTYLKSLSDSTVKVNRGCSKFE